jgi:hypothetical protein
MERTDESATSPASRSGSTRSSGRSAASTAMGYLFFGAPNDRPTAQPERDFYVYFIQPFDRRSSRRQPSRTRCSSASRAWTTPSSATCPPTPRRRIWPPPPAAAPRPSTWTRRKTPARHEQVAAGKADDRLRGHLPGQDQDPAGLGQGRVAARPGAPGSDERINFRDVVNVVSGLALGQRLPTLARIPHLLGAGHRANRKQLVGNALRHWPAAPAPRMPMPSSMRWNARWRPHRPGQLPLRAGSAEPPQGQGPRPGAQPQRTAVGHVRRRVFRTRSSTGWSPICWSPCWAASSTPATSCCRSPATRSTPASSPAGRTLARRAQAVQARRSAQGDQPRGAAALFELLGLPPGLAQKASQGGPSRSISCRRAVSASWCRACSRRAPTCSKASSASGARTCCARKKPKTGTPGWKR